ncbi:MAG: tetratricopeptide repeat protein [Candidatus Aquicultorales bacterium]
MVREALSGSKTCHLIELAKELVQEAPESQSAWFLLAAALKNSLVPEDRSVNPTETTKDPDYPQLLEAFDRLVFLDPAEPAYLWNRAMLRQSLSQPREAIDDLEAFLRIIKPEHAMDDSDYRSWLGAAYDHLGCDYLAVGRTIEAYHALKKSVELNPWYRYSWEDLAAVHEALGNPNKAAECQARAELLEP